MVWLKLETIALFIEPTSLLFLSFFKKNEVKDVEFLNEETGEVTYKTIIPSTYGAFAPSEIDNNDKLNEEYEL